MTGSSLEAFRNALVSYSPKLLQTTADRAARFLRTKKQQSDAARLEQALANRPTATKLVNALQPDERAAFAVFLRCPYVSWRWDHAIRLLAACGIQSPYRVLQSLLAEGLVLMQSTSSDRRLARFEVPDGLPAAGLPRVALAWPLTRHSFELEPLIQPLTPVATSKPWRETDGWELPLRMALVWQLAHRLPIKRTLQGELFKRDQERLATNPLVESPMLDAPVVLPEVGILAYAMASEQGWLPEAEEQSPTANLGEVWPEQLGDLLIESAASLLPVDRWNELSGCTPIGLVGSELPSARFLLLLLLSTVPPNEGARLDELAERLAEVHPPWRGNGRAAAVNRPPGVRPAVSRLPTAAEWVRACVLGPLYQCRLVAIAGSEADALVRLTGHGRHFLGLKAEADVEPVYPETLLVQPNHEIIVYRQGLSVGLLSRLILFAEPKSLGAALTFEVNASAIYHGLEAGIDSEEILALLRRHSGRATPTAVAESIRTWSGKRERVRAYVNASIFEFTSAADLNHAVVQGLVGERISERMLVVPGDQPVDLKPFRLTASRDYRHAVEPCVEIGPDGVTLKIDVAKSDLLLETELKRFAEPLAGLDDSGPRIFHVTSQSLGKAHEQGLSIDQIEQWYHQRTGGAPPPAVSLLFRALSGVQLPARSVLVITAESPAVADGLLQHPQTASLFRERLGPVTIAVDRDKLDTLRQTLHELGIELAVQP
jgi:hypothetical protein